MDFVYNRTYWEDRLVERPRTYQEVYNADGSRTDVPAPGEIITPGTPINAKKMNNIEEGIVGLHQLLVQLQKRLERLEIAGIAGLTPADLVSAQALDNWRFCLISAVADDAYTSDAEAATDYDDAAWETVNVPHDWAIAQTFDADSATGYEGGYLDGGDAWYRATVNMIQQDGRRYVLSFDGAGGDATVYVNGQKAQATHYGHSPFAVDVTDLMQNGDNAIAVFVRSAQPAMRGYSGSGLFRPVELLTCIDNQVSITDIRVLTPETEADMTAGKTTVTFNAINRTGETADCAFTASFYAPGGTKVASAKDTVTLTVGVAQEVTLTVAIPSPVRWTIGDGKLYEVQITASTVEGLVQTDRLPYGYRTIRFDAETGFYLNGEALKLHGVCMHHDGGCIGAAENRSDIERRVALLQTMGCNAVRLCHNPFGATYLDVCQRMGMLVVEECFDGWTKPKQPHDFAQHFEGNYSDVIASVIRRDWNNPAVIMWSIGNEMTTGITGEYTGSELVALCQQIRDCVRQYDTTRPVTLGNDRPGSTMAALLSLVDVVGINYSGNNQDYQPDKPIFGSETTSALSSRGVYAEDADRMVYPSYDNKAVSWGTTAAETLNAYQASERSCGHFVWTGFDYLGEPTEWNKYPAKSSYFGILDTCGFPKDIYYMYQSMWTESPMVHILPHWTHETGDTVTVWLYANCAEVELYLNGTSLGRKALSERGSKNEYAYEVAYTAGTLVANGYDANGELVAQDVQYTSGAPAAIALTANLSSVGVGTDDLCYITCDVVDACGTLCPAAAHEITFTVTGGQIVGTDNGHGANVEKMQGNCHAAFSGKCLCVVKHDGAAGSLTVTATAEGLQRGSVTVIKGNATVWAAAEKADWVDAENPPRRNITIPAEKVELSSELLNLTVGDTRRLTATVSPAGSTDAVEWDVKPSGVATVTDGVVKAIGAGSAVITATAGAASAECTLIVNRAAIPVESLTLSTTTLDMTEGDEWMLTVSVNPYNADHGAIVWTASPSGIVKVSAGNVTALSAGEATVTVSCDGHSASCRVNVAAKTILVESLTLSDTSLHMTVGGYRRLSITITPADATVPKVVWSSSDKSIAYVDGTNTMGTVFAVGNGSATIYAACGGKIAYCCITVESDITVSVSPKTLTLHAGEYANVTATLTAECSDISDRVVTWSSTRPDVADVEGYNTAVVFGILEGTATITAALDGKTDSCAVTVLAENG